MDILYEIFDIIHDAGITLVILAVIIKSGQNPKHILAYMLFVGILLLICKLTSF